MNTIAALYCFTPLDDPCAIHKSLQDLCQQEALQGTLLVASEGLNGTVAGSTTGIDALSQFLSQDQQFANLSLKISHSTTMPFYRLKVRLKQEIVTLGQPQLDMQKTGLYVGPQEWNAFIKKKNPCDRCA